MIRQLKKHVSDEQIKTVVSMIMEQYKLYCSFINTSNAANLFRKEYASHYGQHCISWAIQSAFESNSIVAEDLKVRILKYGKGFARPELYNDKIKIHILSSETDPNANYLKELYRLNKNNFSNEQLYCIIKYNTRNNRLNSITLCLPDEMGRIIEKEKLLNSSNILKYAA